MTSILLGATLPQSRKLLCASLNFIYQLILMIVNAFLPRVYFKTLPSLYPSNSIYLYIELDGINIIYTLYHPIQEFLEGNQLILACIHEKHFEKVFFNP